MLGANPYKLRVTTLISVKVLVQVVRYMSAFGGCLKSIKVFTLMLFSLLVKPRKAKSP